MQNRNPLSSASLRNRLLVGVLLLSALGFTVSDFVAQNAMQKFLLQQVDQQLISVADGALLRVDRAGIQSDSDGDEEGRDSQAKADSETPLRSVPSSVSITLLDPFGNYVGGVGGDLNAQKSPDYVVGTLPASAAKYGNRPFTLEIPGSDFRVLSRVLPSAMGSVFVAQSLSGVDETSKRLRVIFVFIGLIALLLIGFASRMVIRVGLRPLVAVEETAEKIAAGDLSALAELSENPPAGARVRALAVAGAFHTPFMNSAVAPLQSLTEAMTVNEAHIPFISNRDGGAVTNGSQILLQIVNQISNPVRWDLCMDTLLSMGVTGVIELAPAGTLIGLIKRAASQIEGFALKTHNDIKAAREFAERHA